MANWDRIFHRGNVEDRRAMGPAAIGGISLTGVALLVVVNLLMGGDLGDVLTQLQRVPIQTQQTNATQEFEGEDTYEVFASTVLGSNNDTWSNIFTKMNKTYTPPKLVLFRQATESGCGLSTSQVGPHYCPHDQTIYIDETFFDELSRRFGAQGGDVAEAYVLAHEVGHHVQNQLGTLESRDNEESVLVELQADCFAGVWANSIKDTGVLLPNEIEEAMDAAAAVGDDRIQQKAGGYISQERWTHGSSQQRVEHFTRGFERGTISACDATN